MKRIYNNVRAWATMLVIAVLCLCSCSEEVPSAYDPYVNWPLRNAVWFEQICDSARQAINNQDSIAKYEALYGVENGKRVWQNDSCEWRMYKSLLRSPSFNSGSAHDSICVHIRRRGKGMEEGAVAQVLHPAYTDSVRVNFAGWLMKTTYQKYDGRMEVAQRSFTKSYVGDFNPDFAAPQLMSVASTVEGFSTALQYMKAGDIWDVYIPQELAYGATGNNAIPAYSTLLFRLNLVAAYRSGSGIPSWK